MNIQANTRTLSEHRSLLCMSAPARPLWPVIHESLHTRGSGLKAQAPASSIGSEEGDAAQVGQTPELPRRWLVSRCVSTMPTASIKAYIVVGPTKAKPFL